MASSGGSGKDTVADELKKHISSACKISLGNPIHEFCQNHYCGEIVPRNVLQDFGESVRRIFGEDTWIRWCDSTIKGLPSDVYDVVIIPDVRKLTEFAHYVVELGYLPIYVKVSPEIARERLANRDGDYIEADLRKTIETQLNFIENLPTVTTDKSSFRSKLSRVNMVNGGVMNDIFIVDNNGSLEELKEQIREWVTLNEEKLFS
ncbi:hypothetical protein [Lactobacillus taiwanensis]|uniref:hypothetical protein n=1 Tax=Lactobacillus taiwanensis TaxID=508451 RepID=UPI0032204D80